MSNLLSKYWTGMSKLLRKYWTGMSKLLTLPILGSV
jgi:hypothetical protein